VQIEQESGSANSLGCQGKTQIYPKARHRYFQRCCRDGAGHATEERHEHGHFELHASFSTVQRKKRHYRCWTEAG
jgi:hypothetical protein